MKKIVFIFTIITIMIGVCGCMGGNIEDKMVKHMNEKYDDEFTYNGPFGGGIGARTKQITVNSHKYPDYKIWVEYEKDGDNIIYRDNYVFYKYKDKVTDYLSNLLSEYFKCEVKVSYNISSKGGYQGFDNNTSFDEFKSTANSNICFTAVISPEYIIENEKMIGESLENVLKNNKIVAYGDIFFSNSNDNFKYYSELEQNEKLTMKSLSFTVDETGTFISSEWR